MGDNFPPTWVIEELKNVSNVIDSLHKSPEYINEGLPMVRAADVKGGFLKLGGTKFVSQKIFEDFSRNHTPGKGDIVISRVGSYFNFSFVNHDEPFCIGQNTSIIVPEESDNYFLYYALISPFVSRQIQQLLVGTSQRTLSLKYIRGLKVPIPPLPEQRRIAHVLGTLDNKIELNRRMNRTLEAMARALFKSWFVDFDPVRAKLNGEDTGLPVEVAALFPTSFEDSALGKIPMGWGVSIIEDEIDVVGGGTPSTKNENFWFGGVHPFATPKDLSGLESPILLDTDRKVTDAGLKKISSGLLPQGTLLMSSRAPVGYLAIAEVPVCVNQGFIAMICNKRLSNYYLLNWANENMFEIKARASGTTFAEISKRNFRPIPIVVPSKNIVMAYDDLVRSLYEKIKSNIIENKTLAELRDTLLPRLMRGEVRV